MFPDPRFTMARLPYGIIANKRTKHLDASKNFFRRWESAHRYPWRLEDCQQMVKSTFQSHVSSTPPCHAIQEKMPWNSTAPWLPASSATWFLENISYPASPFTPFFIHKLYPVGCNHKRAPISPLYGPMPMCWPSCPWSTVRFGCQISEKSSVSQNQQHTLSICSWWRIYRYTRLVGQARLRSWTFFSPTFSGSTH